MKKTYIQPATSVTVVAMQQMICDSQPRATINTKGSVEAGSVEGRRGGLWEDEDE